MDWLTEPLEYPFMQRALIEIVIVGTICGLVGSFVVLRGLAFIGDALAHAVFPGVVLAYMADRSILAGSAVFGFLTALGVGLLSRSRRVSEDSAIGVMFASFFALGVVIISREDGFRRDLGSLLFGNIVGVSWNDVYVTAIVAAVAAIVLFVFLKELTLVAFDSTMARSVGYPVFALDMLVLLLVTATIVISLQTVGNVLVLALIVIPAATARLLTDRLNRMLLLSAALGMASGVAGLYFSFHFDTAAGGTVVLTATALFLVAVVAAPQHGFVAARLQRRRGRHHVHHYHHETKVEIR
jgi:manganese/iron transport system permease protein